MKRYPLVRVVRRDSVSTWPAELSRNSNGKTIGWRACCAIAKSSSLVAFPSSTTNPFQTSPSGGSSSVATSTPSQTTSSNSSGGLSKTAIIAIAVIGGLAVIVGVILAWIYCLSGCFSRLFSRRPNGGSSAWASQAGDSRRKKGRAGRTEDWILQARSIGAGASQSGDLPPQPSMGHPHQGQYMHPGGPYGQAPNYGYNAVPSQGPPAYSDMGSAYHNYGR